IELRSPTPFSFRGFGEFNAEYARLLEAWGLFVDGVNPVARTNVAPTVGPPAEPVLYGFSYSRPCGPSLPPPFVVAGAGELPEGVLDAKGIFRAGDTSPEVSPRRPSSSWTSWRAGCGDSAATGPTSRPSMSIRSTPSSRCSRRSSWGGP